MSQDDGTCEGCGIRLSASAFDSHTCDPERVRRLELQRWAEDVEDEEDEELSFEDRLEEGYRMLSDE